ncbi:DUF221-domain-containing protein [Piromyces finnis]|uniref:DUF221-domain-containing protein n=1 Tax=Piromyces finnis TaxID=1754191 RepID=A0A1Y1VIJ5_9FUNG|nr:DUF221-domain-containing protein [Piromyces finnis]|eukprot:ORX57226.1 DUF221-domain-containing protein [Piromyces finnis]
MDIIGDNDNAIQDDISHWKVDRPSIIGLIIQVLISIVALTIAVVFLNVCRKYKWGKLIYFKRLTVLSKNTPEYKEGLIDIIKHIHSIPDKWIVDNIGLDAAMFIRMFKFGATIFAFGSIIIVPILLPVNYFAQTPDYEHYDNTTMPFLSIGLKRFSIANVPHNSNLHIIHAILVYIFSFYVCKKLYDYYTEYLRYEYENKKEETLRNNEERSDELTQFRTVLVQGIPVNYRTDKALKQWFIDHDIGEVENAFVMRDYDEYFIEIYNKRQKALLSLERAYCEWIKNVLEYQKRQNSNNNKDLTEIVTRSEALGTETPTNAKEKENSVNETEEENELKSKRKIRTLTHEPTLSKIELETIKKEIIEKEKDEIVEESPKKNKNISFSDNSEPNETTPILNHDVIDKNYIIESLRPKSIKSSGLVVDSIEYYTERLIKYTKIINESRKRFFDDDDDPSVYTTTGFVTFKNQHSSTIASQVILCSSNNTFDMICTPAPHYNDIIWENIDISIKRKILQNFTLTILTIILIIFWFIPVSFISGLATIDKLENIEWLRERLPWLLTIENLEFLQTLIPPMITNLFMTLAPYVFYFISSFQCFESRSAKEQSVMGKYYIFLLVNMLFVFAISNAFFTFLSALLQSPMSIVYTIGSLIPQGSTYFINLVAHYPVSIITDFTKPYLPFLYWFKKLACKTPRDYYNLKNETYYPDYCYILPPALVIIVITIVYSIISPFILLCGFFFCIVGYYAYKYQILYYYVKEWEYYGKNWVFIHDRIVFGLLILQFIMLEIFVFKGCYLIGFSLIPAIFGTALYYYIFKATYERRTIHLPLDQYSSSNINYENYKKNQKEKVQDDDKAIDLKEMQMEEIMKNAEQDHEGKTAKTPGFYEHHSYFWPLITNNLSGIWVPSNIKEILGEENTEMIGRLPEDSYENLKEKLKLMDDELQIPCYFVDSE